MARPEPVERIEGGLQIDQGADGVATRGKQPPAGETHARDRDRKVQSVSRFERGRPGGVRSLEVVRRDGGLDQRGPDLGGATAAAVRALSRARRARVPAGFFDRSPRDGHAGELSRDQCGQVQLVARSRRDRASFSERGRGEREVRLAQRETRTRARCLPSGCWAGEQPTGATRRRTRRFVAGVRSLRVPRRSKRRLEWNG